jgi:hypothetical protein
LSGDCPATRAPSQEARIELEIRVASASAKIDRRTDANAGTSYNQKLSEQRATRLKRFLLDEFQLPADMLICRRPWQTKFKPPIRPATKIAGSRSPICKQS